MLLMKKMLLILLCMMCIFTVGCQRKEEVVDLKETSGESDTKISGENDLIDGSDIFSGDEKSIDSEKNESEYDAYVFPNSATQKIEKDELIRLSLDELEKAKNEIFARYGHDFSSKSLKEYFEGKSWYNAVPGKKVSVSELNKIEQANVNLIDKRINRVKEYEEGEKKYDNPTLKILDENYLKWGDEVDNGKYLLNDNSDSLAKEQLNKKGAKKRKIKIIQEDIAYKNASLISQDYTEFGDYDDYRIIEKKLCYDVIINNDKVKVYYRGINYYDYTYIPSNMYEIEINGLSAYLPADQIRIVDLDESDSYYEFEIGNYNEAGMDFDYYRYNNDKELNYIGCQLWGSTECLYKLDAKNIIYHYTLEFPEETLAIEYWILKDGYVLERAIEENEYKDKIYTVSEDLLNNYGNKRTQVYSIDNAEELKIGDKIQIIEIQIGMGIQLKVERKNGDQFYIGALGSLLR